MTSWQCKSTPFDGAETGAGSARVDDGIFEVEEFEQIAEEEQAAIELPEVLEECAQHGLPPGEHLVKQNQIAQGSQPVQRAPEHVGHAAASGEQPDHAGDKLPGQLRAFQSQPVSFQPGANGAIQPDEERAGSKQAQLSRDLIGGQQPVVIPGEAFLGGDTLLPGMLLVPVMHDNPKNG